nr:hypothetical protein [uncultured Sphingomonas sp.]
MYERIPPARLPACGANHAHEEARSPFRAETMTVDALRPYWSGLFSEKRFFTYHRCCAA